MTLNQFFAALQNPNMVVSIFKDNAELTKIYASGYAQLNATLLADGVDAFTITSPSACTVTLAATPNIS